MPMPKNTKRVFERSILFNVEHVHTRAQETLAMIEKFTSREEDETFPMNDALIDQFRKATVMLEGVHGAVMEKIAEEKKRKTAAAERTTEE